ncbi:MAG TPA: ABC transporter ATP-binding protein [Candidatus Limiplasma sp.]|nr:ABC transporter ATP-binding protein [Candidatus Limiplasma sp.]
MNILEVERLCKAYPAFRLKDVSFVLEHGYIMGFIGSNGAGKTTTLKTIMKMVNKDSGTVRVFGQDFDRSELEIKQKIGFMMGETDYFPKHRLGQITDVVRCFYPAWDEAAYRAYLSRFHLDEAKRVDELSSGMRVKYSLTLALSHRAELLILDEPTSGLDPVARDDLLELFQELIEDGDKSILFSTHITSDLEKCADFITYIKNGTILESCAENELIAKYRLVKGPRRQLDTLTAGMVSYRLNAFGFQALMQTAAIPANAELMVEAPTLEDIMVYHERKGEQTHESAAV